MKNLLRTDLTARLAGLIGFPALTDTEILEAFSLASKC